MEDVKRIIIPVDKTADAKEAVEKGAFLANALDVEAKVITVNDTHQFMSSVVIEERLKKEAMAFLDEFKEIGKKHGVEIKTDLLTGNPAEEIVKYSDRGDIIVMAHHKKRKGIDKFMEKSVSQEVVKNSNCSVLVVK